MKKFLIGFIFIITVVMFFTSCKKDEPITIPKTLLVTPVSENVSKNAESFSVNIESNTSWTLSSNEDWCILSIISGSNNDSVNINVEANNTANQRIATITVEGIEVTSVTVSVVQDAGDNNNSPTIADIDGNTYQTVKIGNQTWMAENLRVTHYPNGDPIPLITEDIQWKSLEYNNTDDAYCFYNNDNTTDYGALYNYAAAIGDNWARDNANGQGVCPDGWHLPSDEEWSTLVNNLGGIYIAGSKMAGYPSLWQNGNLENSSDFGTSGFDAIPSGGRLATDGLFYGLYSEAIWWSSKEADDAGAGFRDVYYNNTGVSSANSLKACGWAVRCIQD